MELLAAFILFIIIAVFSSRVKNYLVVKFHLYNTVKRFPGPKAYPLIGNAHLLTGGMEDITNSLFELNKKYQSPWRLWIGTELWIFVEDPDSIESILKSSYAIEKSEVYAYVKSFLGDGLLTAPGLKWQMHRKILQPIFNKEMNQYYTDVTIAKSITLANMLESFNEKEINILHYVNLCSLDTVYDALFGTDLNLQNNLECEIDESISSMMEVASHRFLKLWLRPDIIFFNMSAGKKFRKCLSSVDNITWEIMKKGKESLLEHNNTGETKNGNSGKINSRFLDTLFKSLNDEEKYSEQDIRDEINTVIAAASETIAVTVSFTLLMLATYPDIQKKVYEELYLIYGSNDPQDVPIIYDDIKNMNLLERVIKETLRIFPPGPFIGRTVKEDIKVNESLIIPKSCTVLFSIFTLHRNEKYWENPLKFEPDRFLPGNHNSKCFLPFSYGKRDCIGRQLAMPKMKVIIATILRRFIVQVDQPAKIEEVGVTLDIILKPAKPVLLRLKKR